MELYAIYFSALALFNTALFLHHRQQTESTRSKSDEEETLALPSPSSSSTTNDPVNDQVTTFKRTYFGVYILVMASDWLQGPYMYTLYHDELALRSSTVAALFTTGFISAGVSATFAGSLADTHGRRAGCLVFCVTYALSCLSVFSTDLAILFAGRALGGLSTTLLYSVFETWMIAEYHRRELNLHGGLALGERFGSSVTLSGVVAIGCGIVGEAVVGWTGTKKAPFLVAVGCLVAAAGGMARFWGENYGDAASGEKVGDGNVGSSGAVFSGLRATLLDKRIMTLAFTTTIFEGCMYLFVFFWSPALVSSRALTNTTDPPPFGLIFSCFMCAMMMGSMMFSSITLKTERDTNRLLLGILALAANAILMPVLVRGEMLTFWSFALFECCVGLYFPTMGRLKSELVDDGVRAKVYGFMRLPLNGFVVLALGATREGDAHRDVVFTVTGALLLSAFVVVQKFLL